MDPYPHVSVSTSLLLSFYCVCVLCEHMCVCRVFPILIGQCEDFQKIILLFGS